MAGPITLAEAKEHLRVEATDTDEDALITSYIAAAGATIERETGYVVTGQRDETIVLDGFEAQIVLPLRPVDEDAVTISYLDTDDASQSLTAFRAFTKDKLTRLVSTDDDWPRASSKKGAVSIGISAGYADIADIPADLKIAAKLLIAHWYANREAVNVGNISTSLPFAAKAMLENNAVRRA
jgi:uncharacterized phiE125 gp8 family phage protein